MSPLLPLNYQPPGPEWPKLLYQDKDVLVVEKPSGLFSNPGKGEALSDSVQSRLAQRFAQVFLIHRLDLATSGVMVFATRKKAEAALKQQFASRQVQKTYLAMVSGVPEPRAGTIALPLCADPLQPPKNKVCLQNGKSALTYYRTLWHDNERALLQLKPVTGRSHQLRVHLQAIGHPILGDALYAPPAQQQAAPRLLLHACRLSFNQPYSGELLEFNCPPSLTDFALPALPVLFSDAEMLEADSKKA